MKHSSLTSMLFIVCLAGSLNLYSQDKPVLLMSHTPLKPGQEQMLADKALDGSSSAAKKLYNHYIYLDLDKATRWAIIGAENGDPSLQYNASQLLHIKQSCNDQRRALFWLRKSAKNSYPLAIKALKNGDDLIDKDCKK